MIPLGLTAADQERFEAGLVEDHQIRVRVSILDLDHRVVSRVNGRVLSGQVDFDASQAVDRTCSLQILDDDGALGLDTGSPYDAARTQDRMVRVSYGVKSQQLPRWVDVPVFTGPIASMRRDDDVVSLTASGKESLMLTAGGYTQSYPKGVQKTGAISSLLRWAGEAHMDIPVRRDKTTAPVVLTPRDPAWPAVKALAAGLGGSRLIYDGRGVARLTPTDSNPVWTFRGGRGGAMTSVPQVSHDSRELRNQVVVVGGVPAKAKKAVVVVADAPQAHAYSAQSLRRNGKPRVIREDIQDDSITTEAAARAVANDALQRHLFGSMSVSFDSLVIPHLEPHDLVRVSTDSWSWWTPIQQMTIPLVADAPMSVGRTYAVRTIRRKGK